MALNSKDAKRTAAHFAEAWANRGYEKGDAQVVLDARANHSGASLVQLYDPDNEIIYPDLVRAHRNLDAAVEAAYSVDFAGNEEKIVAHLFALYAEAAKG